MTQDPTHSTSPDVEPIGRRRFLSLGVAAGVTAGAAGVAVAVMGSSDLAGAVAAEPALSASADPAGLLWRLNPSWGFPMSSTGRCECNCRACVNHGANKIFFDRAAAETGRAHVGCVCIAESFQSSVDVAALRRLSSGAVSVDRRSPAVAELFQRTGGQLT